MVTFMLLFIKMDQNDLTLKVDHLNQALGRHQLKREHRFHLASSTLPPYHVIYFARFRKWINIRETIIFDPVRDLEEIVK